MAKFTLNNFIDLGTKGYHTATSWRVTKDVTGIDIIDESLADTDNLYAWITPLPNGNGGFYADLNEVHLWIRVHILNDASPWTYIGMLNQNDQTFTITNNGAVIDTVNSIIAGIQ